MKELIKVTTNDKGQQLVSARELYEGLKYDITKGNFTHWIEKQLENVDAVENIDFTRLVFKNEGNNASINDYILTVEIAKEICMVVGVSSRTNEETRNLSKQFRKYFIECEKIAKNKLDSITVTENAAIANEYMKLLKTSAETLHMNENSILYISKKIYKDCNIPTTYLPDYTTSKGILKSATELLRKYNIQISTRKFNKILIDKGLLREVERKSTKDNTKIKKFKNLVNTEFGENQVNPNNPKETQPMYYEERFEELLKELGIK